MKNFITRIENILTNNTLLAKMQLWAQQKPNIRTTNLDKKNPLSIEIDYV
jgi:hypothetical protein